MPPTSRATVVLPVPGLPVKTRCRVIVGALQAGVGPQLLDPEHGDLPVDLALDPLQPDQGVELGEQLLEALRPAAAAGAGAARPAARRRPRGTAAGAACVRLGDGPGADGRRRHADRGGRVGHARRRSWAAAATEALPMTRIVGSPSSQAAEATSASASA